MADFKPVTGMLSVAAQITTADIDAAIQEGYSVVINNRPDGEELNQPTNESLAEHASSKGIKWLFIPVAGGQLTLDAVKEMNLALQSDAKTLAFCRSGTRSCNMWGLTAALSNSLSTNEIIKRGADAGYDLSGMASTFDHIRDNISADS